MPDAVSFYVKSEEILSGHIALEDDLVPVCYVADVRKSGIELLRPEEGNRVIRDSLSHLIV